MFGRIYAAIGSIAASHVALATAAQAQDEKPQTDAIFDNQIIVTAQRREQSILDVGVSVTALQGEDLEALGLNNSGDVAALIPAVSIQSVGGAGAQLVVNIRGVSQNDFGDHNEPPIAVYVDEAYVGWLGAIGMQNYDMMRVEVLRGPQGTLFGRNATGGLIHFVTNKPREPFDASIAAQFSSYDSYRFEGAVGGGVSEDVSVRIAGAYEDIGAYIDNRAGHNLGDSKQFAIRGQLLVTPTEKTEILLKGEYSSLEGGGGIWTHRAAAPDGPGGTGRFIGDTEVFWDPTLFGSPGCAGCDALGYRDPDGDPDTVDHNDPSFIDRDIYDALARITYDFGDVELTSITNYRSLDRQYSDDSDGGPFTVSAFSQDIDGASQFSQELRLSGEHDRLSWVAGGYYLTIEGDYLTRLDTTVTGDPTLDFIENSYQLDTESFAFFGQTDFSLNSALTLVSGLRWTRDQSDFSYENTDGFGGSVLGGGLVFNSETFDDLAQQDDSNIAFNLGLEWRPNADTLLYGGVSRATKAGGFSASVDGFLLPEEVPYEEEQLTSFHGGIRAGLFNGAASLSAGAFYYDYDDYQAFLFEGLTQKIVNLDAELYGMEVELTANPTQGLDMLLGMSWLEGEASDVPLPDGTTSDRPLPQSPNFSVSGLLRYAWDADIGELAIQGDGNFQTDYNYNIVGHETTAVDDYAIFNGRVSFTPQSEVLTVSVFVNNIFDERYAVSAIDASGQFLGGVALRALNRPRWIGGEMRLRFQ